MQTSASNGSLAPGLWLTSPAGWLPRRTGISSGTLRSVIEYGLPFLVTTLFRADEVRRRCRCLRINSGAHLASRCVANNETRSPVVQLYTLNSSSAEFTNLRPGGAVPLQMWDRSPRSYFFSLSLSAFSATTFCGCSYWQRGSKNFQKIQKCFLECGDF